MKIKIFLISILVFFLATRLYKISEIPVSLYWDEASIGYNADSILNTGKDEWGDFLPIHFKAFGEFKLPVYIYSVVLSEFIFGNNAFAVRIPAVLFCLVVLILTFLITKRIYKNIVISLISTFILSISPWFFIFSRTGYEATVGLMFYLLGIYLSLIALNKKYFFLFAFVSFIFAIYSYNSYRIIVPLTIIPLVFIYFKHSINKERIILVSLSLFIFLISLIPIYYLYRFENGSSRFDTISIVNLGNSYIDIGKTFTKNYLSHFSLDFLLQGDKNLRSQQSGFGQIYLIDLIFILIGLFTVIRKHKILELLPIYIILVSLLPAAITKESPHALRTLSLVPFLIMILSVGLYKFAEILKYKNIVICIIVSIYLVFFSNYYYSFLTRFPKESAQSWQYAYSYIFKNQYENFKNYNNIFVTDVYGQPYIFYMFLHPKNVDTINLNPPTEWGNSKVASINNIYFQKISDSLINRKDHILIFSSPQDKLNISPKRIIKDEFGKEMIYVYEIN